MRKCGLVSWLLILAALLVAANSAAAQTPAAKPAQDGAGAAEAPVRQAITAYRAALDKGAVDEIASFWAEDADYVDQSGHSLQFKELLARARDNLPEGGRVAPPSIKTETLAIRLVTPDVAIEDGVFDRPAAGDSATVQGRYSTVWVRRDGRWLIDGVREAQGRPLSIADRLQVLGWMVGEWTAEGNGVTAEATCTWGPDRTYLLRQLQIQSGGARPVTATQWIGWDPIRQRIHSFVFDSRGGFSAGHWTNEGDAWAVTSNGVTPDGKQVTATNLYTHVDDNTAIWESINDNLDGPPGADIRLRATRKQPVK